MHARTLILLTATLMVPAAAGHARSPQAAATTAAPVSQAAQSPAEGQFRSWLNAFNSGDRAKYEAFLSAHFPSRAARVDGDMGFFLRTGGFDVRKVESVTATRIACLVEERGWDNIARAVVEVEPTAPHRILSLSVDLAPRPADMAVQRLGEADLAGAVRAKVDAQASDGRFQGAVLVARGGKVIFSVAKGLADRDAGTPNTPETRFRMGSMNKMFTATAILQLVQAGRVKLDAPLGTYLTDYPNREAAAKVTIHHLLTHTGGTGDIFGPQFTARRLQLKVLDDYVKLYGARGLEFEPGSKWQYSNYGFLLLGAIVERVSGQSYYDYVRDHIFKPAGMTGSGSEPEDVAVPGRAKGYMQQKGAWVLNTDTLPYRGTSAGGGYTTVGDLLRFATALTGHVLLDERHTALLTTGKVDTGQGDKYAYGFVESTEGGVRSVGHSGGAPGMNGDLRIFPDSGYVVAALANTGSGASQVVSWVSERLPMPRNPQNAASAVQSSHCAARSARAWSASTP
jgi:CubicO group peptidase (beta-lactamase class C family)